MADGPAAVPASGLDSLSTELVEHICVSLNEESLLSLRRICRRLHEQTQTVFGATCFHTIQTDLSVESLFRLDAIGSHPTLRLAVRTLRTGLGAYRPATQPLGHGCTWPRTSPSGALDLSSESVKRFHAAAARFPNCTTWEVNDALGNHPEVEGTATSLSPTDGLHLFLSALGQDGGPRIRVLRVNMLRSVAFINGRHLPLSTLQSAHFRESWAVSLEHLQLRLMLGDANVEQAVELITAAKGLRKLDLYFPRNHGNAVNRLLERLANSETPIPPLTELRIAASGPSQAALSAAVGRFQDSLQTLYIGRLTMEDGCWATFFEHLQRLSLPNLESLVLFHLGERRHDSNSLRYVFFCPLRTRQDALRACGGAWDFTIRRLTGKGRVEGVRFCGSRTGMRLALEALAEESSHYLASHRDERGSSPGLPDMWSYAEDKVGRLYPGNRFDEAA